MTIKSKILGILFPISIVIVGFCANYASSTRAYQEFLNKMFESYDKGVRPNFGGETVTVGITLYVLAITDINEKDMTMTLSMYFRQSWRDPRLAYQIPANNLAKIGQKINLHGDQIRNIWEPDTFVVNEVNSFQHKAFVLNEFVRIDKEGTVLKSGRYTVTTSCPMDFRFYPFDVQSCTLEIESFGSTMADIQYKWHMERGSVGVASDVSTPSHKVLAHRMREASASLTTGNYSRITVEFVVQRSHGRFILRFFTPLILFVLVSLLSLWIASEKMATLINFLNICFINLFMAEGSSDMPTISYATTLDVYFVICIFHVGLCLLDSLIATYFAIPAKGNQEMEMTARRRQSAEPEHLTDDVENLVGFNHPRHTNDFKRKIRTLFGIINLFIKSGLFISFLLCNFVFFGFYSTQEYNLSEEYTRLGI